MRCEVGRGREQAHRGAPVRLRQVRHPGRSAERAVDVEQAQHLHVDAVAGPDRGDHIGHLLPPRGADGDRRKGAQRGAGRIEEDECHCAAHAGTVACGVAGPAAGRA